ncbi:MAG: glycosyltransferase [Sphingopyxis sp.]|uniref:glycosyltransferase n=1 Tax=Sphingopyxis sp. TaxID=1908224 RepID=UPI002ABB3A36|nr:glycosyltransferase [Sphingopyxis sp.]MDZ3833699.1 glycosyltransferase [Sphingopyxis sp.]
MHPSSRTGSDPRSDGWTPQVTVIVPHYQDPDNLANCLAHLARQTYPAALFEIVVADNGSAIARDRLDQVVDGRATVVIETRKGAGLARNAAAAVAKGEVLAFIDSDCLATPDWLRWGVMALHGAGFVGGDVTIADPQGREHSGAEAFEKVFAFNMRSYAHDKNFAGSGNLFVRRADFEKVGGFKVGISEDMEWSHRAAAHGLALAFEERALVTHPPRRNWAELTRKWKRVSEELYAIACSRPNGRLTWFARSLAMPLSAIAHLPRMFACRDITMGARFRGAGVLIAIRMWRMVYGLKLMIKASTA